MENSLKEKARKVFKGLSEKDYAILKFFCEKGPTSKYKASVTLKKQIPRATIYRKIQNLKEKEFLKVVGHEKFERGSLKSDVEILSVETVKSSLAVFGSGIEPRKVIETPSLVEKRKSIIIGKLGSYEKILEFQNNILDSLIEVNEDLTDKKGDLNILHIIYTILLVRKPDYMNKLLNQCMGKEYNKKAVQEFIKTVKFLQKEGF